MTLASVLRFLADESCDRLVIRALREDGYDVFALSEVTTHTIDREVIAQSMAERRVLLTEDKDFGWLVFVEEAETAGVILMRFPATARSFLVESVRQAVRQHGDALIGSFTVVQLGSVRLSQPGTAR